MGGLNLHDLAERVRAALAVAPEAGGYDVLLHAGDDVYALDTAQLDGTCEGTDVFRLMALDHDDDGHPVVPLALVKMTLPDDDQPTVVCVSCGRTKDRPPRDGIGRECEVPEWHQPQPYVPDADVGTEDGDDLVPMDDADWQAAVGPRPGQTWADLYGRTHVALSYKGAQLEGVTRELLRVRQQLHVAQEELRTHQRELDAFTTDSMRCMAAMVVAGGKPRDAGHGDDVLELRTPKAQLYETQPGQLLWYDDPASDDRVWQVKP